MTTQFQRWPSVFGAICVALACAILMVMASAARVAAQPFAAVVMDARSGQILYETDNSTARIHPASLTKMMTLYIAFEALENGEITLDTRVRISRHAASQPPSRLGLRAGQTIAFRYLIRAAALRSANDAAAAIAEAIEGSVPNFARRMNRTARAIGMNRTQFRNPHGLTTEGHLSSARDMSILGRQLFFDHPDYYNIFSRISEDAGIATVNNTNRRFLSSYRGADGIKTGYTSAAGYNLTAMAERDGVRILVTVMGARSSSQRLERVVDLMDRGFRLAPRRVAVRRPDRPDYVRADDDRGSGVPAGRVIRLQTAPTQSRFPRPRPQPGQAPSAELIATLRDGIDEVIDDIREPDPQADTDDPGVAVGVTSEEPDDDLPEGPPTLAIVGAPETSPVPRARPEMVAVADPGVAPDPAEVARAAGFTVIDPAQYAALTEGDAALTAPPARPEVATTDPVQPDAVTESVLVADGAVTIPGLPPIPLDIAVPATDALPAPTLPDAAIEAQPPDIPPDASAASLQPATPELAVDAAGRILWRDEELLDALETEDPEHPILAPTIVLTTSDGDAGGGADTDASAAPMPEIVTRASTTGGRQHAVELGAYPSRFDAERVLMRVALSETMTLGTGVRRVAARGGRFVAVVENLGMDEAELACLRLVARDLPCTVIEP